MPKTATKTVTTKVEGKRVREQREARDWSQGELSERCGIDRAYISRMENGMTITQHSARTLAAAFDEPENWLLYMTGAMD